MNESDFETSTDISIFASKSWEAKGYKLILKHTLFRKDETDGLQKVFTPYELCHQMMGKLNEYIYLTQQSILVIFNVEFVDVLVRDFHVPPENITFFTDARLKELAAREWYGVDTILEPEIMKHKKKHGFDTGGFFGGKKFDVVVGNPPYQAPVKKNIGGSGSGSVLWDSFVQLALDITNNNGYITLVHPALWRKPKHKLWKEINKHHLLYLEINNKQQGQKTFGATTRYDWYVLQKNATGLTEVKFEDGASEFIDLPTLPFLPNYDLNTLKNILVKDEKNKCKIIYKRGAYDGTHNYPHMSQTKKDKFVYPCITSTNKSGIRCYYSNRTDRGLFGVSKVIFGDADIIANAVVDFDGEYGMTQHAMAIPISSKEEGEQIKKALETEKFNDFLKTCRWSNFQIDCRMFEFFKKDFWKEFV